MKTQWYTLIGLEIHVQLNTKSKIFSPASNSFGDDPNVNIHPCCMGFPGSLPMVSEETVNSALKLALAIDADINRSSSFDRKSYFYPDSPRNYQITQFYNPIIQNGKVKIFCQNRTKTIRIKEAHIEDDTAIMKHLPNLTAIDFNRAGIPLIEIVTMPDMQEAQEAVAFVTSIKQILEYLKISECDMENGNLRVDANVSVTNDPSKLNNKCEIKNLNSLNILSKAIQKEVERQISFYEENPNEQITSSTYKWSAEKKDLLLMREKTTVHNYMYFKEPDLLHLVITDEMIEKASKGIPELPFARMERFLNTYKLDFMSAEFLVSNRALADFYEEVVAITNNPGSSYNWMCSEFAGHIDCPIFESNMSVQHIADIVMMVENKKISTKTAKELIEKMLATGKLASELVNDDQSLLLSTENVSEKIKQIIDKNMSSVMDYKNGKKRALDFVVGQVLKELRNHDPSSIRQQAIDYIDSI